MAAVIGFFVTLRWTGPAVVVLAAGAWMVLSLVARHDELPDQPVAAAVLRRESVTAAIAAGAMVTMALAMSPG